MAPQFDLLGEFGATLDSKGRFRLPSGLLRNLGDRDTLKFVVNRGFDGCLTLYPKQVWDFIKRDIDVLSDYDRKTLRFKRAFYAGATEAVPDSADRLLLPKRLVEWAGIEKNIVLAARDDRIEIWAEAKYNQMLENLDPDEFSDLAQDVFGDSLPPAPEGLR